MGRVLALLEDMWKDAVCINQGLNQNFNLFFNFKSAEGHEERNYDARDMSYAAFLSLEGRINTQNPYHDVIMNTPLALPDEDDVNSYLNVNTFLLVNTAEALNAVVEEILACGVKAVGIDVEFCAAMSYQGNTSLLQLSTPFQNYVIDPLSMFSHLHVLNKITINKNIVKVLHNPHHDVAWLQKDFGVYIVNSFDTGLAAKLLGFEKGHSLEKVLFKIFNVQKDTEMTTENWSKRPLSRRMLEYAVNDSKYLLPLYKYFGVKLARDPALSRQYESELKKVFAKKTKPKIFFLEKETKTLCQQLPVVLRERGIELIRAVLAWRNIRSRLMDVSHQVMMKTKDIPPFIQKVLEAVDELPPPPINKRLRGRLEGELQNIILMQIKEEAIKIIEKYESQVAAAAKRKKEKGFYKQQEMHVLCSVTRGIRD